MSKRREGRQLAVQFLYQHDLHPKEDVRKALDTFWGLIEKKDINRTYVEELINGVLERQKKLDELINSYAKNWDVKRMAPVDRNILRLALYEMNHRDDIPPVAAINEAIEVAKALSTDDSGRFVNGILDRAKKDLDRPDR
jgi:N utilization substance protein B